MAVCIPTNIVRGFPFLHTLSSIYCLYIDFFDADHRRLGEGNGTPLQYCCPENPMDGGAWWADVYGVTQSQTN